MTIRVMSDLHSHPERPALAAAARIEQWAGDPQVHAIVLAGDTWEGWAWPVASPPPTLSQIIAADTALLHAFRSAADAGKSTYCIIGNHDGDLCQNALDLALGADRAPLAVPLRSFDDDAVIVTHGHEDAIFCANDDRQRRPCGYWLTRMLQGKAPHVTAKLLANVLLDAARKGRDITLAGLALDQAAWLAGMGPAAEIVERDPQWTMVVAELSDRYADLWTHWTDTWGAEDAMAALLAELATPEALVYAMRSRAEAGWKIVVTGHTHVPTLAKAHRPPLGGMGSFNPGGESVLLNTGCHGPDGRQDWAEIDGDVVRLYDGDKLVKEECAS